MTGVQTCALPILLDENGEFQDFYYSSGIEYEDFQQWIPDEFSEAAESCYEFSHRRHPDKNAKDILKAAGKTDFDLNRSILLGTRKIKNSTRACTLMDLLVRYLDSVKLNSKKWFFC